MKRSASEPGLTSLIYGVELQMNDACSRFLALPDQLLSSIAVEPVKEMLLCSLLP